MEEMKDDSPFRYTLPKLASDLRSMTAAPRYLNYLEVRYIL